MGNTGVPRDVMICYVSRYVFFRAIMPRTYIRKKIKSYNPQDLSQAIAKVKNGELTQYRAAQHYKIPMTTLHEHLKKGKETTRPNAGYRPRR